MGKIEGTVALGMFGAGYVAANLAKTMNMQLTMFWISSVIGNVWWLTSSLIHFACIGVVSPHPSSRGEQLQCRQNDLVDCCQIFIYLDI